jgi:hypothetical protein
MVQLPVSDRLHANIKGLAARFPSMVQELEGSGLDAGLLPDLETWLCGCYGPEAGRASLLARWVSLAPTDPFRIVVTTGIGDGSHVNALLNAIPASSTVVVLECNPTHLMLAMLHADLVPLLRNPRVVLLTPFSCREGIADMGEVLTGNRGTVAFPYQPLRLGNPGLHDNVLGMLLRQLITRANQVRTEIDLAEWLFANTITNLARIGAGSDIRALNGSFQGIPLVLVAAGPSLDTQLDFLRSVEGKALLVVVNSAWRAVTSAGIIPDLTVAVDPREFTAISYRETAVNQTCLVCSYQVHPEVVERFEGRIFPLASANPLASAIRQVMGLPEDPAIIGDGTVSSTVVNLAAWLGCDQIYLVGQDLAIGADGQTHVTNSFYTDQNQNHLDPKLCQWLPGNSGEPVPVESKLLAYLRIFENLVSHYRDIRFYNLSPTGARIHGVPHLTPEDAYARIQALPPMDFRAVIAEQARRGRYPTEVTNAIGKCFHFHLEFLRGITRSLLRFAIAGECDPSVRDQAPASLPPDHPIALSLQEILHSLEQHRLFATLLQEGRSKRELRTLTWSSKPWKPVTDTSAPVRDLLPHAWAWIEGALYQIEVIEAQYPAFRSGNGSAGE